MTERKTIHKWYWAWAFDAEERWLNAMALEGWALEGVGFCTFRFARCEPGEYVIRLEMHERDDAYIAFMKSTGAEYVGRVFQWVYFRKKAACGEFDIFSDMDSRISHLARIANTLRIVGAMNIVIGVINSFQPSHIGFLNLLCACLMMYGLGRVQGKAERLKNERTLHE